MEGLAVSFWRDRPTFVTGATGLVGAALVRRLLELRADVVALVRDWVPSSELVRSADLTRIAVIRGDVRDQALLERALGEYEIQTVFHLAAQTTLPVANRNPIATFETNVGGTWRLLEACRRSPTVRQTIVASSDKAYDPTTRLPYTEETPLAGRHPYDASKSCADLIAQTYAATYGLSAVISRCGNFYGPGDLNWNRIVPGTNPFRIAGRAACYSSSALSTSDPSVLSRSDPLSFHRLSCGSYMGEERRSSRPKAGGQLFGQQVPGVDSRVCRDASPDATAPRAGPK